MKIKGKCVLITGSAKRCGAELAKTFAASGAKVIVHCHTSVAEAEELCAALPGSGHRMIQADLAEKTDAARLISQAGRFDILINNAGTTYRCPIEEFPDEEYDRIININMSSS